MRVDYIRDGLMEEFHEGIFVQFSKKTDDISSYPYYMRSCAKPLQATLLVDCNADLTEEELALCCGSHSGEECHAIFHPETYPLWAKRLFPTTATVPYSWQPPNHRNPKHSTTKAWKTKELLPQQAF